MQRREFLVGSLTPAWTAIAARNPASSKPPALIPYPQQILWTGPAFRCAGYDVATPPGGEFAAAELDRILGAAGGQRRKGAPKITLRFGPVSGAGKAGADEA